MTENFIYLFIIQANSIEITGLLLHFQLSKAVKQ